MLSERRRRGGLALVAEGIVARKSPLDLPATVFAGAVSLGLVSYFLGIHNATYERDDGVTKQAGFLWAPNWTLLFTVFMPLFFIFAADVLTYWKDKGRAATLAAVGSTTDDHGWSRAVEASPYTYWAALVFCLGFAGVFQWIEVRLIPLLQDREDFAIDWGSLAIVRPDLISRPLTAAFTGFAYLYMSICFYLFSVGLILMYTMTHDFHEIHRIRGSGASQPVISDIRRRIMRGIFRCTIAGMLIAICMKLQSSYLTSHAGNILEWLISDFSSAVRGSNAERSQTTSPSPTHYTSLLVALMALIVFLHALLRLGHENRFDTSLSKMVVVVALIASAYLAIDLFVGFSILLGLATLAAFYGLFEPVFGLPVEQRSGDS